MLLAVALCFSLVFVPYASCAVVIPVTTYFPSGTGSYLNFAVQTSVSSCYMVSSSNATYGNWIFFDGGSKGFYLENINATVTNFFSEKKLELNVSSSSADIGVLKVFYSVQGAPISVSSVDSWSYLGSVTSLLLTSYEDSVLIDWNAVDDGGSGDGGVVDPVVTPSPAVTDEPVIPSVEPSTLPFPTATAPPVLPTLEPIIPGTNDNTMFFGALFIVVIILATIFIAETKKRKGPFKQVNIKPPKWQT